MTPELPPNPFTPGRCALHPMPDLQYAVYNIWYAGVRPILALLEAGADLNATDEKGTTALQEALYENRTEIYALLVQAGADQHIPNKLGMTPAMAFEREFGMTCEEKFKDRNIDAEYFRKQLEDC